MELKENELKVLHFVVKSCCTSGSFPSTGAQWKAYRQCYAGHARANAITLSTLIVWN